MYRNQSGAKSRLDLISRVLAFHGHHDLAEELAAIEVTAVIRKENGKYCVRSPKNPNWNGGCYDTEEEAEERLRQVEYFKQK